MKTPLAAGAAPSIKRQSRAEREGDVVGFQALRSLAIDRVQAASGAIWTDYNLHDPGVTILEAVCYALTELAYRADFDVADHLCGPDGQIDFDRQALFPPQSIFPSRATTVADYRRLLIDQTRVAGTTSLDDVRWKTASVGAGLDGLHHVRLLPSEASGVEWDECVARARAAYRQHRGLGEDLDQTIAQIQVKFCSLALQASVQGTRDPVDVVAEIYDVCATHIAPRVRICVLDALLRDGQSLDQIFTGPRLSAGFIEEADLRTGVIDEAHPDQPPHEELSLSDLRTLLLGIDGVAGVTALSLQIEGEPPQTRSLNWDGDEWAPRLLTPTPRVHGQDPQPLAADVSKIKLERRGAEVKLDAAAVAARYADIRAGRRPARRAPRDIIAEIDLPRGVYRPAGIYYSLQNHFPSLYRLGPHSVSQSADTAREAHVEQFRAYLSLFDQVLANATAQIDHLRDLFTPVGSLGQSYWRDILTDKSVPGIQSLYVDKNAGRMSRTVYSKFDDVTDRRNRVLDHLLALYGETYAQNTSRQFLDYMDSKEQAETLLENKADFLKQIVVLSRDRSAGFDYGLDLWQEHVRTPGFQRRVCLLLGFRHPHARALVPPEAPTDAPSVLQLFERPDDIAVAGVEREHVDALSPLDWPLERRATMSDDDALSVLTGSQIPGAALFKLAVGRQNYHWRSGPDGDDGRLYLGAQDQPRWWDLGAFEDRRKAGHLANWLRRKAHDQNDACEGLHVVEHILLRPRVRPPVTDLYSLRMTLVFPGWTARTSRQEFRDFAEETVSINSPAHVAVQCIWLSLSEMREFEGVFGAWMGTLRDHCQGRAGNVELDAASQAVLALIPAFTPMRGSYG